MIILVFIPGLLLYDCALKLAAHFLSKHCFIRTLAKSTAWQEHCLARHFPEAFSEHGLHTWPSKGFSQADQPTRGEQIVSDGGEFFAHTTTTGCIDPNPYFPICSELGGFSGHATPSLTTSSKNSIILLAPILIFSFVCRLKVTLARGRLQCDLRPL